MVPNDGSKLSNAGGKTIGSGKQPKVVWDNTHMRSAYANVTNVMGTREEIVLMFGKNRAWDSDQRELEVELIDRIMLNPFVAKRFSLLLNNILEKYESRFGALEPKATRQPKAPLKRI